VQVITPHSNAWYDRLSKQQDGYYYPWQSTLGLGDGESAYLSLVGDHLSKNTTVLDVGCGHGDIALEMAPLCHSIIGYDRVESYIQLAEKSRVDKKIPNVSFICHDSHKTANEEHTSFPVPENSIDLVISRRGPTHWIEDARRICRQGSSLIQLNPMGRKEEPDWNQALPELLQLPSPDRADANSIVDAIEARLAGAGLCIHSAWTFDVPEWFHKPLDLYKFLTFGEDPKSMPTWEEVEDDLERVFACYSGEKGLEDRQRRFLWKTTVS
jgi:SAM-dependent methyltransferase